MLFLDVNMYLRTGFEPGIGTAVEFHPRTLTGSGVLPPIPAPRGAIWALLRPVGGSALTGAAAPDGAQ